MQVTSLGFRTDLALRALEGAEVTDRGDYTVVRSPDNPTFWWGNFLLLAGWPEPGTGDGWLARFAAEFPQAGTSRWAWTPGVSPRRYRRSSWLRAWSSSAPPC